MNVVNEKFFSKKKNNYKSYLIGFIISIILTVIPFSMAIGNFANKNIMIAILITCAIAQIIIHLIYFLHLNVYPEEKWNIISFLFTMVIIVILITGSLWIMWHLNYNLMGLCIDK